MTIYQNLGIKNSISDKDLPERMIGLEYVIKDADISKGAYFGQNVLEIAAKGKCSFGFGLIGEKVYELFMKEMNVTTPQELIGKKIIGYHNPDSTINMIEGISKN